MGVTGLAIAYLRAEHVFSAVAGIGSGLAVFALCLFSVISVLYLWKLVRHPAEVLKEFNHPVRFNFFPAITISLLLLAIANMEQSPVLANALWIVGAAVHLVFTLIAIARWIDRLNSFHHFNPAWFIPVVGNILVPIAGVEFASKEISWFFFSIGFVFWLCMFTIMLYRLGFHDHLPSKLFPTLFILIAPPAVGFISYFKLTGSFDPAARILLYIAIFTALLLFTMVKKFIQVPFFLSWWGYTFPLCALTISLFVGFHATKLEFFRVAAGGMLVLATLIVLLVASKTINLIRAGKLLVPEE